MIETVQLENKEVRRKGSDYCLQISKRGLDSRLFKKVKREKRQWALKHVPQKTGEPLSY